MSTRRGPQKTTCILVSPPAAPASLTPRSARWWPLGYRGHPARGPWRSRRGLEPPSGTACPKMWASLWTGPKSGVARASIGETCSAHATHADETRRRVRTTVYERFVRSACASMKKIKLAWPNRTLLNGQGGAWCSCPRIHASSTGSPLHLVDHNATHRPYRAGEVALCVANTGANPIYLSAGGIHS